MKSRSGASQGLRSLGRIANGIRIEGAGKKAFESSRERLLIVTALFVAVFAVLVGRMVYFGVFEAESAPRVASKRPAPPVLSRAEIVDRNGAVLATNLKTVSLVAEPRNIRAQNAKWDPSWATERLLSVLPELDRGTVYARLSSDRGFVYLKRNLTPSQQVLVNNQGIPGLYFKEETKRLYPQGALVSHVLGSVDIDSHGIAGVEAYFDHGLACASETCPALPLSIDVRVQHALRDELERAVAEFSALGAVGIVLDARNGEVLAMISLPDFDPNNPPASTAEPMFNRATKGVYEMGSTFKTFTLATALESGVATLRDGYDASQPIRIARFVINDDHPQNRFLTLPEIFMHSSNIGAAKMAIDVGSDWQRNFMKSLGMLERPEIELQEVGSPQYPKRWGDIATMTVSYGHGIAVTPLHLVTGIAAMVNGGTLYPATLLRRSDEAPLKGRRVISEETSRDLRGLLHLVVKEGTGRQAGAKGYRVGGKTGTAEKASAAGYQKKALISSFIGAFPMDDPRYVVLAMIDEPKGTKATYGFATAGWTAAPVVGRVIPRIAPLLGVAPVQEEPVKGPERLAYFGREDAL